MTNAMISITNISPVGTPKFCINHYVLKFNNKIICAFENKRTVNGLARCLRDAADAVEAKEDKEFIQFMGKYLPAIKRYVG